MMCPTWMVIVLFPATMARADIRDVLVDPLISLEVVDESNRPVVDYTVVGKAPICRFEWSKYISDGKYLYESLPLGPIAIAVTAEGFRDQEASINVIPGEENDVRIVLERE